MRLLEKNKDTIVAILRSLKAKSVEVSYSGCGDSGQIEDVQVLDEHNQPIDIDGRCVAITRTSSMWNGTAFEPRTVTEDTPLKHALSELTYDSLEERHPGWEDGDGANGTLRIDLASGAFTLEHGTHYMETTYEETTL
jgi:hypothetical protein